VTGLALGLAAIAGLAAAALGAAAERARSRRLRDVARPRQAVLVPGADRPRRAAVVAFALGIAAAVAALASAPDEGSARDAARGVDVVLCLDVSRSMLARDVAPDRLSRARAEVRALSEHAKGDRLALVVFAGEARTVVPLTTDLRSLADLADAADPSSVARGGTDLAAAIEAAAEALAGDVPAAVVLLTDGEDLAGRGARAARTLAARGVAVHALAFGTELGGKVPVEGERGERPLAAPAGGDVVSARDLSGLERLAQAGGGAAVDGNRRGALVALHEARIAPRAGRGGGAPGPRGPRVAFQAPLAAALLLFAIDLGASRRRRR
jgi:Ca-activated chloride channel family protein